MTSTEEETQLNEDTGQMNQTYLIRQRAFDPEELAKITGINGWDTRFTSCNIDMADYLYFTVLRYMQENFDDVDGEELSGFNYNFDAAYTRGSNFDKIFDKKPGLKKKGNQEEDNAEEEQSIQERKEKKKQEERQRGIYNWNSFKPGLGMFRFKWEDKIIYALHQSIGHPGGSRMVAKRVLILFIEGRGKQAELQELLDHVMELSKDRSKPLPDTFRIYRYAAKNRSWQFSHKAYGRAIESVVLPKETKDTLLTDLDDFLSTENKAWYLKHGIPYKRCYLFYGVPGSGKTSLISVIAGLHKRTVCYLSPTDAAMSDDTLRHAIQYLPDKAIVVLEDIDALFTKNRETKARNTLTFSGLLNALDGVGSGMGQIFILSTNYRERLDKALIRNGRVDRHIKFDWIKPREMGEMFAIFYEDATKEDVELFSKNLCNALANKTVSAATLQHFFIAYRKCTKEEAIRDVGKEVLKIIKSQDEGNQHETELGQIYS